MTQQAETDEQPPTEEQLYRAAVAAQLTCFARDHGGDALLELLEGLDSEHQREAMEILAWYDERQEAQGNA